MTFRATLTPGIDPAATIRAGIGGNTTAVVTAGQTITLYSQAVDVTCSGRTRCRPDLRYANDAAFVVGFNRDTGDPANAVLDWTADVEFLRLGGDPVPPDGSIDLVRPSPLP
jgi:hypothetical protein